MRKLTVAFVRDTLETYLKEEISFSRMVELLNEEVYDKNAIYYDDYPTYKQFFEAGMVHQNKGMKGNTDLWNQSVAFGYFDFIRSYLSKINSDTIE